MKGRAVIKAGLILALLAGLASLVEGQVKDTIFEVRRQAEQAYATASREEDHEAMGDALMILGMMDEQDGKPGQALRNYFTAMREYEWAGSAVKVAAAALAVGDLFLDAGLHEKALEYFSKAMEQGGSLLTGKDKQRLQESVALAYFKLQLYGEALRLYRELEAQYGLAGDRAGQIYALRQVNTCLNNLERYDEALEYNRKALAISRETGDRLQEMAALNNLGYTYKHLARHREALDHFSQAVELGKASGAPVEELTVALTNMAIILQNQGKFEESIVQFSRASEMASQAGLKGETARIKYLAALAYYLKKDYYNAGQLGREALALARSAGDADLASSVHLQLSQISAALYDYELSMEEYRRYLSVRDSVLRAEQALKDGISQQQYLVERTEKELDGMLYSRQVERLELNQLRLEAERKAQEVELLKKTTALREAELINTKLEKDRALQELLLAEERLAAERKDREIRDLKVQQQLQESELRRRELEQARQEQEIRVLLQEKEIDELNLQKVRARNRFLAGLILLAMVILVIVVRGWRYARKTSRMLEDQRNKIHQQKEAIESQYDIIFQEREKSEKLLLNILPAETAAELKEKGYASPRQYERVTVLFTDFVGFTMVAEKLTPEEIVGELDYCFLEFDRIIDRHKLEKIKTIGDSYMCAGGIPVANDTNPVDVVMAALEIRDFMEATRKAREDRGEAYWQLRIGVHTGPVVAGVVGKNKFAYDIWGDAVNTASRMESSGEAGKVNISGATYEIIKDRFVCNYRGKIKAKNKGEVDMYFVEGPKD